MDDGEIELPDPVFLPNSSSNSDTLRGGSTSVDLIFDEILKHTKTCTHTHTCNPPGPDDAAHTHTCYHTHTQVFSSEEDTKDHCSTSSLKPRKPVGNREAVRKYREKKKAHTAFLEEEVKKLRLLNQHLVRKVQGQAALEAEILRLRALLVDLKGKIDAEMGSFPFQNHSSANTNTHFKEDDSGIQSTGSKAIGLQCQGEHPCFDFYQSDRGRVDKVVLSFEENCQPAAVDCDVIANGMLDGSDRPLEAVKALVSTSKV